MWQVKAQHYPILRLRTCHVDSVIIDRIIAFAACDALRSCNGSKETIMSIVKADQLANMFTATGNHRP